MSRGRKTAFFLATLLVMGFLCWCFDNRSQVVVTTSVYEQSVIDGLERKARQHYEALADISKEKALYLARFGNEFSALVCLGEASLYWKRVFPDSARACKLWKEIYTSISQYHFKKASLLASKGKRKAAFLEIASARAYQLMAEKDLSKRDFSETYQRKAYKQRIRPERGKNPLIILENK